MNRSQKKWTVLCFFVCFCYGLQANGVFKVEIREAAQRDLPSFLGSIRIGDEPAFGFANRQEMKEARLGHPYRLITIDPVAVASSPSPEFSHIRLLDVWRFPLICKGTMRSLLTVARVRGKWQAVALGAAGLAGEIQKLELTLTNHKGNGSRSILRLFRLGVDFIVCSASHEIDCLSTGEVVPLNSALRLFSLHNLRVEKMPFKDFTQLLNEKLNSLVADGVRGIK